MFLADPTDMAAATKGSAIEVAGDEGRHAVSVVRISVGERVLVSDGAGTRAEVLVTDTAPGRFAAQVLAIEVEPEPSPRLVLVQALAKGDRDEQAVETATEIGVDEVVPWQADRSIVRWRGEAKEERGRRRWEAVVLAATKQSRRARMPVVSGVLDTSRLRQRVGAAALAVVLHEEATTTLADILLPSAGEVLVIVGPEGGITAAEVEALVRAGAVGVRLGREVLRSSTAGPAALAVLSARSRWT